MVNGPTFVTSYLLDVEWQLTWFPNRSFSSLQHVKMRGGHFSHRNTEDVFIAGNREVHILGQGGTPEGDPMAPDNRVGAFIDVGMVADNDLTFDVRIEVFN